MITGEELVRVDQTEIRPGLCGGRTIGFVAEYQIVDARYLSGSKLIFDGPIEVAVCGALMVPETFSEEELNFVGNAGYGVDQCQLLSYLTLVISDSRLLSLGELP